MTEPDYQDYGHYCVHGTNLGTYGGPDLMCGLCEVGLTVPVDAHLWEVGFAMTTEAPYPNRSGKRYWNQDDAWRALAEVSTWCDGMNERAMGAGERTSWVAATLIRRPITLWCCPECKPGSPCSQHQDSPDGAGYTAEYAIEG